MCIDKCSSHARLACVLLFVTAIVSPFGKIDGDEDAEEDGQGVEINDDDVDASIAPRVDAGLCQNAAAHGTYGDGVGRPPDPSGDNPYTRLETHQQYGRDAASERTEALEENRRTLTSRGVVKVEPEEPEETETEAKAGPRGDERGDKHLLLSENGAKIPLGRNVNVTISSRQQEGNFGNRTRKKRRRTKESKSPGSEDRAIAGDSRENEVSENERAQSSQRRNNGLSKARSKNREARKSRAERRRRKNKNRRERNGSDRRNSPRASRRSSKYKRKTRDELDLVQASTSERTTDKPSNVSSSTNHDSSTTTSSSFQDRSLMMSRLAGTIPRTYDTVEKELSKQLEMEISRSAGKDSSILDDGIFDGPPRKFSEEKSTSGMTGKDTTSKNERPIGIGSSERIMEMDLGGSRYDAEKMLGYSRTEEDLPILELENEVLERTLKDYNAYMTSRLKLMSSPRREEFPPTNRRISGAHPPRKPIINSEENDEEASHDDDDDDEDDDDGNDDGKDDGSAEVTTTAAQEDGTRGDLSCINGTFLPAPLSRYALIKYVKSSTPGHEYLEADYECAPGFRMTSPTSRLVCRSRQWVGQVPKCEIKQYPNGLCAEAPCEHACNEINGRPVCSCYKGYRLDGRKCVDINECLLNNGHGPCQDTCRNLVGGYECSCDSLEGTSLAADNHTCERDRHIGPCSVNNAGCSHTCLSTMGRVFCLCPDGFMLEDDWKTCQDVDECSVPGLQTELCRFGCINTPGSYRCAKSMEPRDQPVLDSLSITCLPGYEQTPHGTCIDINECVVDNGGCAEVCENTDGSFFCACDGDEKVLSSDGKSCVDINSIACLPLNPVGRGYLICSRLTASRPWHSRRKMANRPGTRCSLKCPSGYQLRGQYEMTCRSDGTWDGSQDGKCVRYNKPRLECPKDVVAELPPGRDEAFVIFDQPVTDLDWFRYVRSKPSWGTRLEANLKPGVHKITFFARHPVSKKQASCVLHITVKGGEAPKVKDCPNDIEVVGRNGTAITWTEPIFTDNVKVTRISNNESPGHRFNIGGHRIEYEGSDDAGWSSKCIFTVVLRRQ